MAVLKDSAIRGVIHSLLIHPDQQADITSVAVDSVMVSYSGFEGDSHCGVTRKSCVRVKDQYPQGTVIRNVRQVSIVSVEELALIASLMNVAEIKPEYLGANLCLSGVPDLSLLPPSSRLIFSSGVSLVVDMQNEPCKYPAEIIERHFPGHGKFFVKHAVERRGVTAWVEREGELSGSDLVAVHVPAQSRSSHYF